MTLEDVIDIAEEALPDGYTIEISVCNSLGVTVIVEDDAGDAIYVGCGGLSLTQCVSKCIDAAIEHFTNVDI